MSLILPEIQYFGGFRTYNDGAILISTLPSSAIRNIFTTTFILLGLAITVVGKCFLRRQNIHRLNFKKPTSGAVPITQMSSWLSLANVLSYFWDIYRLPGGFYGLVMALTGAFGIAHQFFINNFIEDGNWPFPNSCGFQGGLITTKGSGISTIPVSNWAVAATVLNAQNNVYYNEGSFGIWELVPNISSRFTPTLDDVLGIWNCVRVDSIIQFNTSRFTNASADSTINDPNQEFLYQDSLGYYFPNYDAGGIFFYSGNETNSSNKTWSLRASMMGNIDSNDLNPVSYNLECDLNIMDQTWTPPIMPFQETFIEWAPTIYGRLMEIEIGEYALCLELTLEAMTMVSGSNNSDKWTWEDLTQAQQKTTYTCAWPVTLILPGIWVLIGAFLLILFPMVVSDLSILAYDFIRFGREGLVTKAQLINNAPSGVASWQLALLKCATNDDSLTTKDLKNFSYGWNDSKDNYELNLMHTFKNETAVISAQYNDFEKQKTEYYIIPLLDAGDTRNI